MKITTLILGIISQDLVTQMLNIITGNNLLKMIFISAIVGVIVGMVKKTIHLAFKVAFVVAVLYVVFTLIANNM